MNVIPMQQGTPEWHKHRARHYNASEAAAMLGLSKYQSRADLIREKATGLTPDVDAGTQKRFDDGHKFEAQAREWAEEIIGEELYPVTVAEEINTLPLSASLDGLTMAGGIAWEHKTLNAELEAALKAGEIPPEYHPQMEQQMLLTGAEKCLFMASKGDKESALYVWYESRPDLRQQLLAGWTQFREDAKSYTPPPREEVAQGDTPEDLPVLRVEVTGSVLASNLDQYRNAALEIFRGIKTELQTDQDFADAESTVKWCKGVEQKIDQAKEATLAQTADIDQVLRTLDDLREECRQTRLKLEKSVKSEKESRRYEIVQAGKDALAEHVAGINKTLGKLRVPDVPADFAGAVRGKKTLTSVRDAVDGELATAKIEANRIADQIRVNLEVLRSDAKGYETLFPDAQSLAVSKSEDDLRNLIRARIAEHKEAEVDRIREAEERAAERARIEREKVAQQAPQAEIERHATADAGQPPVTDTGKRIKLGDINAMIAPLSITAAGLASLGFFPSGQEKAAKLYRACDVPVMLRAMIHRLEAVGDELSMEAA